MAEPLKGFIFDCIDAHTCGNPVRLVTKGGPALEGNNMSEKRQHFLREFDWIRKGLMFEPRGHDMMSGSILYPPHDPAMTSLSFLSKPVVVCLCAAMVL
jgi:4-hydroxyproline epimerase